MDEIELPVELYDQLVDLIQSGRRAEAEELAAAHLALDSDTALVLVERIASASPPNIALPPPTTPPVASIPRPTLAPTVPSGVIPSPGTEARPGRRPPGYDAKKLCWYHHIWAGLPVALVTVGGASGAIVGTIAYALNLGLLKSRLPGAISTILTMCVTAGAALGYLSGALKFATLTKGEPETSGTTRVADFHSSPSESRQSVDSNWAELIAPLSVKPPPLAGASLIANSVTIQGEPLPPDTPSGIPIRHRDTLEVSFTKDSSIRILGIALRLPQQNAPLEHPQFHPLWLKPLSRPLSPNYLANSKSWRGPVMRIYYDGAPGNTASTDFWVFDARTKRRIGTTLTPGIRKQNTTIMTADVILDTWHDTPVFLVVNRRGEENVLADLPLRTGTHSFLGGYVQIVAFGRGELDASSPLPIGKTFAIKPGTGQPDSEPPDQGYMIARFVPAGIEWDCYPAFSIPYRYTDLEHKKQEIFTGNHSTLIARVGKRSSALKGQFVHYRFPMETGAIIPSMIRGEDTFLRWPVHLPINFADVTFQLKGKLPQRAIFELPGLPVVPKTTKDLFDVPIPFVTVNGAVGMLEVAAAAVEFTLDPTLISKVRIYSPTEVINTSPRDLIIRYQKLTGIRLLCDPEAKTIRRASWFNWP